jgi:hypothetical protein
LEKALYKTRIGLKSEAITNLSIPLEPITATTVFAENGIDGFSFSACKHFSYVSPYKNETQTCLPLRPKFVKKCHLSIRLCVSLKISLKHLRIRPQNTLERSKSLSD